ncbi:WD40/YVTN/BNR-like repeat-containing protein [Gloeocapsopsis dulcis]|uniref:Glycosyl hydrolase n=1 Tax=Gloeocapsopsis dulcis AAB1 = 1H9 TaxID=1433147 RepID=A0A6N8FP89_9CHRO|nr:hypothetical protein [Gloeocapsopsis dulcis]MUL34981.1 hypothetical protein [Gloeocapsopsis dulcis AAB1 = 1H9]WNN89945.1 hypothetical protein P0S91_02265 [Gloeocapsopsis dulcis]
MTGFVQQTMASSEVDASHDEPLIVGTNKGLLSFSKSEQRIELEGHNITAIAPSLNGLWVVVDRKSVWHRGDRGEWQVVASTIQDLQLNCIQPLNGKVLVGTSQAHLLWLAHGSIEFINSFDLAPGRDEWYTPWGGSPAVRSLAVGHSGELYTNVHVGGILRSKDRGHSWQPTIDLHSDVHQVLTVPERPGLVLAATAKGLAISINGGDSWSFDQANLHATYSRAVAVCDKTILMSTSLGPSGAKAAIYRRVLDQPGTFEKCEQGLPQWFSDNINTGSLATLKDKAAFGTSDGQLFVSEDAGLTWKQLASGLPPIRCVGFS